MGKRYGAFCLTADAIVPIPEDGWCEWCGSRHHLIRYVWNLDTRRWDNINTDPGHMAVVDRDIPKIENYEDGI